MAYQYGKHSGETVHMDYLEFIARVTSHIPDKGQVMIRYYGPEFTAKAVRMWLAELRVTTLFIEPGSPWENGYVESFNGKLRDELLNGEIKQ